MGSIVKRSIAGLLAILALSLCPLAAYATPDTTITVGPDKTYQDLASALNAIPENAGNVTIKVSGNINKSSTLDFALEIPSDRSIDSLRIDTDAPNGASIGYAYGSSCLFASGIPVSIGSGITLNATLYGGSNKRDLTSDTSLIVEEGATVNDLRGGCLNGTLTGSTSLLINGTVRSVVAGGGSAKAPYSQPASKTADITGSCSITIGETGAAKSVYGGGEAVARETGSGDTVYQANVDGSTTIVINGRNDVAHGGGTASIDSNASDHVLNAQAVANVDGDTSIVYGPSAQALDSAQMSWMGVYGGGKANGSQYPESDPASGLPSDINAAIATVGGSTAIEAMFDNDAATEQKDCKAFSRFFGGGEALNPNAQADVTGGTSIKTARIGWDSNQGIVGGGFALHGATANVQNTTHVEVFKIEGQIGSYENADQIVGGGLAENYLADEPYANAATTAAAGATEIVVHSDATLASSSVIGLNVIGGGLARGNHCSVNVQGEASTIVEKNTSLDGGISGGGVVWGYSNGSIGSSANVGSTNVKLGSNVIAKGLRGGGGVYSCNDGQADVNGSVALDLGSNVSMEDASRYYIVIAGGYLYGSTNSHANVGSNPDELAIVTHAADGLTGYAFYGGGFVEDYENRKNTTMEAKVTGSIENHVENIHLTYFFGGSCVDGSGGFAHVDGSIENFLKNCTFGSVENDWDAPIVGASVVWGNDPTDAPQANVTGNVTTTLETCTINGNGGSGSWPYAGGRTGSDVQGNAKIILLNTTLTNQSFYGSKSDRGAIGGVEELQIIGDSTIGNWAYPYRQDNGTFIVTIGDEVGTATNVSVPGLLGYNDNAETNVSVLPNATLTLTNSFSTAPYHLQKMHNVDVAEGAQLVVTKSTAPASLSGNLSGEGTISLPAGGSIAGSGTLDGALTLEVTGTPAIGQTYFDFSDQSVGSVSYTDPNKKLVLEKDGTTADHAKWIMRELTYPVTFSLNDGTEAVFATQTIAHNQKVVQPDPTPEREGYVFNGWFKDAEGEQAWDFDSDTVTDNLTLYAKWTLAEYTVSFEACGGFPVPLDLTVKHGTTITEPAQQPTKKDFVFAGWYTDAAYNGDPWDFDTDTVTGDMTLYAKWDDGITVNVEVSGGQDAHGTVAPATPQIFTGEPLQYTLTPDYGYRIETVTVDSTPLPVVMQADLRTGVISYEPESPSTITVTFVPLDNQAADDIVESLPTVTPEDPPEEVIKKTETVLDAKLDYESMPEDKKETVKQETVDKLNDAIASLPNVDVEVDPQISTELASNIDIPDEYKSRFIGAVSKDEIEKLKTGAVGALKVVMEIKDINVPTDANEQTAFEGELGTYELGQHFLASVTKQLYKDKDSDPEVTPITTLPAPVKLTFDVPASLINKVAGTTRSFAMVRTHLDGTWQATFLDDEDGVKTNEKVTVSTDRFSTYSIVYKDVHHVTFDSNGGSKVASQDIENNGSIVKPTNPAREGFTFDDWYEDPDSSTAWDFATNKVTAPLTLYAKWVKNAPPAPTEYTVTFVANGGTPEPSAQTVVEGNKATEPTAPEKTGFKFDGWFSDEACTKAWGFTAPVTDDLTLYAKWTPKTYNVTFEANGGSETPDQTVPYRGAVAEPADPSREGFTFAGWWKDAEFTSSWNFTTDTVSGSTTLYAKWTESVTPPADTFTVVFDARGGTPVPETQTVDGDSTVEEPTAKPEKTGYEFGGWFSDTACTKAWEFSSPVTTDLTLYAKWTAETYTVTFNTDGGQPIPDEQTVAYGQLVQPVQAPEKEGFEFVAWYVDADLTVSWDFAHDVVEGPVTLYAKWNKVPDEPKPPIDPVDPDKPDNPTPPVDPDEPDQPIDPDPSTPPATPTEPAKPAEPESNGKQPSSETHVEKPQANHASGKTLTSTGDTLQFDMLAALAILGLSIAAATRVRMKRKNF